ncbi:MAG: transposase [Proteobacteria bacterium]|nr:transposase [Pseudomonadota bacterium]
MGKTKDYSTYKALRAGNLSRTVPAQHSSQDRAACGHFPPDNQPTQAASVCPRCGHPVSADANASRVIAQRGVDEALAGSYRELDRQRTMRPRFKGRPGLERSEGAPMENTGSLDGRHAVPLRSVKCETPATTPCVVAGGGLNLQPLSSKRLHAAALTLLRYHSWKWRMPSSIGVW